MRARLLFAFCVPLLFALCVCAPSKAETPLQSADAKMEKFSKDQWKRGEVVTFSPAEVDAWVRDEVPKSVPQGMRDPKLELGQDTAVGSALVDFVKIERSKGKTPGMISKMFEGERPLRISVRLASGGGKCTVFLTRLEVAGTSLQGYPLDLLIKTFFKPLYPDAAIGEPFDLDYNIDRIELRPEGIRITIKK